MTELRIKNLPKCIPAVITNVVQLNNDSVQISWDLSGINYTSGSLLAEVSINGGASFISLQTVVPTSLTATITNAIFANTSNGQSVIFRLTGNSLYCSNMVSNRYQLIWAKSPSTTFNFKLEYSCNASGLDPSNYTVYCGGINAFTLQDVTGGTGLYKMKVNGDSGIMSLQKSNGNSIALGESILAGETLVISAIQQDNGNAGNFPAGQYIPIPPTNYVFQYSNNNGATWSDITIIFTD